MEGLRALAALAILVFHLDPAWLPGGFIGVDVFFVISGFLITGQIAGQGSGFSYAAFYRRRARRLWPALIVTVLATFAAGWFLMAPRDYAALGAGGVSALLGVSNIYFTFTQDYFAPSAIAKPLLHLWSLSVEEQFYLVWPAVLLWGGRDPAGLQRRVVGLALASLALAVAATPLDPSAAYYMMPTRGFAFALGGWLRLADLRPDERNAALAAAAGLGLLAVSLFWFSDRTAWPSWHAAVPAMATALVILGRGSLLHRRVIDTPGLVAIGRASYSIYLVHWPIIALAAYAHVAPMGVALKLGLGLASLVAGFALYLLVEDPFRPPRSTGGSTPLFLLSPRLGARVATTAAAAALVAGAGILGAAGFPSRFGKGLTQQAGEPSFAGDACNAKFNRCSFGDPDGKKIVYLVGDSHALNLVAGLDVYLRRRGYKGIGLYDHGCLFVEGSETLQRGVADARCARNVRAAYALLAGDRAPVILAGAYASYAGAVVDRASGRIIEAGAFPGWLTQAMTPSLVGLGQRPMLLMAPGYDAGHDVATCRARGGTEATCPARPAGEMAQLAAPVRAALEAVRGKAPWASVIDPVPAFCDTQACRVTDGATLLFRDKDHLTVEGSRRLIERLSSELDRLLP